MLFERIRGHTHTGRHNTGRVGHQRWFQKFRYRMRDTSVEGHGYASRPTMPTANSTHKKWHKGPTGGKVPSPGHYRVRCVMGRPVSSEAAPERQQVPEDLFTLLNGMLHQVSIKKTVAVAERWSPVRNINVPHTASSSVNGFIVRGFKTIYDSHELHILLCNVPASKCMYWRSWWTQNEWIIFHEYSWREWVEGSPMPSCAPKSAACVPRRREYLRPQRVKWLK